MKLHPLRRIRKHIKSNKRRYLVLVLILLLFMWCVQKFGEWGASRLECTETEIAADNTPGIGPLKIALISDVHANSELFTQAVDMIQEAKPDLIVFCGDLVYAEQRFMRTKWAIDGFRKLKNTAPTFAVLGNHDYEKQEQVERVFQTAGIPLLRNQAVAWTAPNGKKILIVGLGDYNEGDEAPSSCLPAKGATETPVLLLSHDPESRHLLRDYEWDIMLSGHTHGGQLGNPFTGNHISFRSDMPSGLYTEEDGRKVFVTRGIGSIMNMRFFCRPEVSILHLRDTSK